ncbi:SH3 and multiple ankyrin repeat domains protein 3-like [Liolophura sinensis]|uniref:SH3 and multiple ankyrin repeat domains protein 3-like n=1 Tax=Liolophura sinensis TaxID=3198878 RepID=UPI0031587716
MKDENVGNSFSTDGCNSGTVYIRINIPELKLQKCLQFQLDDSVWQAKQRILATFAKDLKDGLNYGLYCPPSNGRAGKFLDEERVLREYPLQGPIGFLEFKYKRRVYKLLQINQRKIKQLHTKANLKQFLDYVRGANVDKITKYTNKGLDPNYHDPDSGETPLTVAATLEKDKVKDVVVSLVSGGAHLDYRNRLGLTSLHKAAIRGNIEALKTLLDLGAAPNYKDGRGLTPLYYSVANDTDAMCSELLLHDRAAIGTPDEQGWFEIHHACRHGRVQHLELLVFYGAEMDVQNASGNTPLHVCAVNNQESCARVLLFRGASKDKLNYANQVPYQVAIIAGNFDLAEIIKNHKQEDIVPFREVPSYSDRRKSSTVTPSMRAVMRCRSDPRLNILTWDRGPPEPSTPDDSQIKYLLEGI